MNTQQLRIGARASKLSLAQAGQVRDRIALALPAGEVRLETFTTQGDRIQDRPLAEIGGKGLFTQELEQALLAGRIDAAVHSLKDMPAESPPGLVIAAIPQREDPRDALLGPPCDSIEALPHGARLGTASLRRQTQARHRRPDLVIVPLRGNVDTRIAKLARGEADAILLAAAGLNRLGLGDRIAGFIDPRLCPPAPGQGALAIPTREADADAPWLAALRHRPTALAVAAERGALAALDGSCRTAVGAYAWLDGPRLTLIVEALTPDGARCFRRQGEADVGDDDGEATARGLGLSLGGAVAAEAGDALLGR
jgi:hydroxymethylbilane synthase